MDIKTGTRRIIEYLRSPVLRYRMENEILRKVAIRYRDSDHMWNYCWVRSIFDVRERLAKYRGMLFDGRVRLCVFETEAQTNESPS